MFVGAVAVAATVIHCSVVVDSFFGEVEYSAEESIKVKVLGRHCLKVCIIRDLHSFFLADACDLPHVFLKNQSTNGRRLIIRLHSFSASYFLEDRTSRVD